ncbi:MAG: phosphatidate cytidylyltransferase [Tannerella sp.]|jgi:phosphatidate cytidylyltransferase|nr:phosphatidate cytidylyltransferase [Tannerella sp.]
MYLTLKNLAQRTLTGMVYVAVIVAAICLHPFLFAGVFGLIAGLLIHEFYTLLKYEGPLWVRCLGIAGGMYLPVASCLYAGHYAGHVIYIPYLMILLALLVSGLYIRSSNPAKQWGILLFAQCYCAGTVSLLCFIPYMISQEYNPVPVLMIFIFIWLNDTGAYLIGSWKGRHPLFQRISPHKSWEGFFGGFFAVVTASFCFACFYRELTWYQWLIFALVTVFSATWGDLIESLLKRTYGVKDSGKILPGHGGILDRFDSVLLASPSVYIYFELLIQN